MPNYTIIQDLADILDPSPDRIGGKGVGLFQLINYGLNVPPAWVVPTNMFTSFLNSLGLGPQLRALEGVFGSPPPRKPLEAIREQIEAAPLPENLLAQINGLARTWAETYGSQIIVRSSATVEDHEHRSFAGIFESITCQSSHEIAAAVLKVWASVFNERAFAYYDIASLNGFPAMAVILHPFVEANRSGVMFTRFAGPDHKPSILVEHVAGRGDKLVTGQINPDRFWMPRWPSAGDIQPGSTGDLPSQIALDLAQIALELETELQHPQDVEWCVQGGELYILQTRPITASGEAATLQSDGEVLLQGVGASPGSASGAVHLVFNVEDALGLENGQVLTTTMTNPDMVPNMQRSSGVITDVGGMICHAAIISRELGIPCVVGTKSATRTLQAGTLVTVDGSAGLIYEGLLEGVEQAVPTRNLAWSDLWDAWKRAVPAYSVPLIPTYHALTAIPQSIERCVLDPFSDLSLTPIVEITPLSSMTAEVRNSLLQEYCSALANAATGSEAPVIYLDLHRLDPETKGQMADILASEQWVLPLEQVAMHGPWQIQAAPDGRQFALLNRYSPEGLKTAPDESILAVPLGFGLLLGQEPLVIPERPQQSSGGMFGMMPNVRMARMPARGRREAMHRLVPALSEAHGGQTASTDQDYPWLDLRPEVVITPFLKALVTPGVETIPYMLTFDETPLHIQFIRCRFHFRQDTLFGFFPKLLQATWNEVFLSQMLNQCRASYEKLENASKLLPADEVSFTQSTTDTLRGGLITWWNTFTEFFSLSFFIQAQGDDCIFPGLNEMAEGNALLLESNPPDWQIPGLVELSAPVSPVLTAEYMQDLLALKEALSTFGLDDFTAAQEALAQEDRPELNAVFKKVLDRWYWMRERDPYYDPYDTPSAILNQVMSIRRIDPPDYQENRSQAELALALHFDLGRVMDTSEKLVYAVKYGRALAIDRENHHIVWLHASYRLRKLLVGWERKFAEVIDFQPRDIFFMQPWEILDAVTALPEPPSEDLLSRIRNRRAAYEQEIQLKAGKETTIIAHPEEDYF